MLNAPPYQFHGIPDGSQPSILSCFANNQAHLAFRMCRGTVVGLIWTFLVLGTQGYNLKEDDLGPLVGGGQSDSLFGWSLQHFKNDLFVGAPREDGKGAVYKCTNLDTLPKCTKMTVPR